MTKYWIYCKWNKHSITHHLHQTWGSFLAFVTCCLVLLLVFQVAHPVLLTWRTGVIDQWEELQTKVRVGIFKRNFPLQKSCCEYFSSDYIILSDYITNILSTCINVNHTFVWCIMHELYVIRIILSLKHRHKEEHHYFHPLSQGTGFCTRD